MSPSNPRPILALMLLLGIGALMGLTSNLVKLASAAGWSPVAYLLWSLIGGGLLLLAFTRLRGETPGMSPRLQRYYLASGLLSIALPNGLLFSSIPHVGAGFASMCLAFPPLITYLLALALRMEPLSRMRLLGICIGLGGSLLLALDKLHSGDSPLLWIIAALAVPVFLALGNIYRSRCWPPGASPLSLAPGMLLGGALLLLPLALFDVRLSPNLDSGVAIVLLLVQMALFAIVYALYFVLQKLAGAVYLSQIGSVAAMLGAAMAVTLLDERGSLSMLLAALCIVGGVLLVAWRGAQKNKR
ncbi:EamA/RhaT family transporter [Pseudomonas daroniae]|uniref:EamA/RhaT family transporter n=1 Tax=Phytopseudomonas daroniae TaxID=2487519 RepID=A0A4Q9QJL0_9GAMM|nr:MULTISPECIES: DMT family transporter [Pseudomonas]TBU76462.1 EamA/RhaT family transporter [Pseudomonas daroniae]TBU80994.1 EamA/RhaT family transporter [Pseudomonas sp. FRB 228]TBU90232.1 EamA/RhaT family transporter [Pseudomonas daroniae]